MSIELSIEELELIWGLLADTNTPRARQLAVFIQDFLDKQACSMFTLVADTEEGIEDANSR